MLLSLARRVTTGGSSYSLNGALVVTICVAGASFALKGNSRRNPFVNGIPTTLSP